MPRRVGKQPERKSEARDTLARNLKMLLEREPKTSVAAVAKRARMSERNVYYMLDQKHDPGIAKVHEVATVFNLKGWQLLLPNADLALYDLLVAYNNATPEGRRAIYIAVRTALRISQEDQGRDSETG